MQPFSGEDSISIDDERLEFLARVASMYYDEGLTQNEISEVMGYSRSAISRFLTEARDVGVVDIRINHPLVRANDLERRLIECYGLKDARVLVRGNVSYTRMLRRLGDLAAQILNQIVRENMILGVGWGTAVYEVSTALKPPRLPGMRVVQLIGSLGTPDPKIDGPELAQSFARIFGGRYYTLPAPLIVDNEQLAGALMSDSRVRELLGLARQAQAAVVGIGTIDPQYSSLLRAGYLTRDDLDELETHGIVGDVCGTHFDADGRVLDIPLARRVVALDQHGLRQIPQVIGVAGGDPKADAIRGALRGRLINILVTDDITAHQVLSETP